MKRQLRVPEDRVMLSLIGAMVLVVLACILTLWKLSALNNTPSWWSKLENNPRITQQSGIELENQITTALTRLRPVGEEDWAAAINQDQLNSWLAHRLRDTIRTMTSDTTIDQFGDIRITINHDELIAGAQFIHAHGSTIVWAVIDLGTDDQGRFIINTRRAYVGSTRVPTAYARKYLTSDNLGKASVDLGDGREVRIRGIRAGDQRLEFALRTQLRD
jgi:hypothetical protein